MSQSQLVDVFNEEVGMDSFDYVLIHDFLSENWVAFQAFCEERGVDADEIADKVDAQK